MDIAPILIPLGLLASYLLGSIPFGLLIGRAKGIDIRQHGSRNIGAANIGRTLGRRYGVLTFVLDAAKGFLPVFIAGFALGTINMPNLPPERTLLWFSFGAAAFLGHLFPIFLKFKGGKGVATGFGALLGMFPILTFPAVVAMLVWAITVSTTRYLGFASCIAALTLPVVTLFVTPFAKAMGIFTDLPPGDRAMAPWSVIWPYFTTALCLALFVLWRHRSNLARMMAGTEPKVGDKPKVTPPASEA